VFAASAGAIDALTESRRGLRWLALRITAVVGALATGCSGDDHAPSRLLDGSPAPQLPVELEGLIAPPVLTRVRVLSIGAVDPGSLLASCVHANWAGAEPAGRIVERTGVSSQSVTFRDRSGRGLYGCDNSAGPGEDERRWCGRAFGRLHAGRLRDPRLDLGGCGTRDEGPVGFAWVQPHRNARYVVVEQPGYAEVYRVAGGLPVRVATTTDIEIEESRAAFRLSEHDSAGRLLRRYQVEAVVAG
jgi:hypothetical protein